MSGIGADDLTSEHQAKPDYERGAGGEPLITMPDGKRERYARTSSLGNTLDETSGLNNWKVAKAMEGLGRQPELVAKVIAVTPYEDHRSEWTKLREEAIQAGRGSWKADMGTAVHAMSERWEQEPDWDPGEPYRSALEAYSRVQSSLGLRSQLFECNIVNDEFRIAGTADRLYELTEPLLTPTDEVLPAGTLIIGDLKTGSSLEHSMPGYAIQLAGYAGGSLYDVVSNTRIPTPPINQRWAIIMHLDVEGGECEFVWVDLTVGRFGAALANEVREWRRNWRRKDGYSATVVPVVLASADEIIASEDADAPDDAGGRPRIDDLDAWKDYARARLSAIKEHAEAREYMLIRWPEGMAPPKRVETLDEAYALSAFLDRVEAEFELPFVEGQPSDPDFVANRKPTDAGSRK